MMTLRKCRTGLRSGLIVSVAYSALVCGWAASPGGQAFAQNDASQQGARALPDAIVVTASRREESLQDVAAAVISIDPVEFTSVGLTEIQDILAFTPGINFNTDTEGAPGAGSITARGIPQVAAVPVVGIYLDDVPFSTNSSFGRGELSFFDGLLGDIERIEVVKGPQGTLYGAVAVGGVVKYISREPALDELRVSAGVNLSTTKGGGINQIYNGRVSVPVLQDRIGVTVSGFYEDRDGYVDVVDPLTGVTLNEDANTAERYGVSADALIKLTDRARLKFKYLRQETDYPINGVVNLVGAASDAAAFGEFTTENLPAENELKHTNFAGTFEYEFDWATLTSVSSYVKYDVLNVADLTFVLGPVLDTILDQPVGTTTFVGSERISGSEKFVQEVRLTSTESERFEWILGLYYTNEDTSQLQTVSSMPASPIVLGDVSFPSEYKEYAVFGDLTYYFTPEFDVTFGARISHNETSLVFVQNGLLVGLLEEETLDFGTFDDTVDTYLIAFRYRPTDNLSLYSRIASGYRPASGNLPLFNPITMEELAGPFLESDSIWSYEIGAKGSLMDGLFTYDVALWRSAWDNFQTTVNAFGVSGSANFDGKLKSQGIEGTIGASPIDGLDLVASFAYTDSEIGQDDPFLGAVKGERHPNVSEWTASGRASYAFPITSNIDANIGGGVSYVGGFMSTFSQSASAAPAEVDGYALVDLNAGLTVGPVSASVYVTNLFDEVALQSRRDDIIAPPDITASVGVFTRPRTVGVSLKVDF